MNENTETSDYVSITEAAKRLGISRPRLSLLLKEAQIEKVIKNNKSLICYSDAIEVVQTMAAQGRLRTPTVSVRKKAHSEDTEKILEHYRNLVETLTEENRALRAEITALTTGKTSGKLSRFIKSWL